jgi:hypothetical protein
VRQNIDLAAVDESGKCRPFGAKRAGDMAQGLVGAGKVRLDERLAQRCQHHALKRCASNGPGSTATRRSSPGGLRRAAPSWAPEITSATPGSPRHTPAHEEAGPERLGRAGADVQADNLACAVGVGCHSDYHRHRDNAAALALREVGGIKPQIRPVTGERTVQEGADTLINARHSLLTVLLLIPAAPSPGQGHLPDASAHRSPR